MSPPVKKPRLEKCDKGKEKEGTLKRKRSEPKKKDSSTSTIVTSSDPIAAYTGPILDIKPYTSASPLVRIRRFEDET